MKKEEIEKKAREVYQWIQDAVGDIAYDEWKIYKENSSLPYDDSGKRIKKLLKEGVTDIPGRLADDYYNDAELLGDIVGDRIYDKARGNTEDIVKIAEALKEKSHPALREACDKVIKRVIT